MRKTFIPPTSAGITQYHSELRTKYYIKASHLFKAVLVVTIALLLLHLMY